MSLLSLPPLPITITATTTITTAADEQSDALVASHWVWFPPGVGRVVYWCWRTSDPGGGLAARWRSGATAGRRAAGGANAELSAAAARPQACRRADARLDGGVRAAQQQRDAQPDDDRERHPHHPPAAKTAPWAESSDSPPSCRTNDTSSTWRTTASRRAATRGPLFAARRHEPRGEPDSGQRDQHRQRRERGMQVGVPGTDAPVDGRDREPQLVHGPCARAQQGRTAESWVAQRHGRGI